MSKLQKNPAWRGEREEGSGRPRKTTKKQDKEVVRWLLQQRGKQKMSGVKLKKRFRYLRKYSDTLVEERLFEADLSFLRRRSKPIVTKEYLKENIDYCQEVKRMHDTALLKWAYTDGTTFFLDRCDSEHQHSKPKSMGTHGF